MSLSDIPGGLLGGGTGSGSDSGSNSGISALLGMFLSGSNGEANSHREDRLPPRTFIIVTTVMYGLAVFAFLLRLYIRIVIQKHIYVDDGFNIFSLILLTICIAVFYVYKTEAFAEEDLINGNFAALLQSDIIEKGLLVRKWITAAAVMLWTVINSSKFSFLFFFRRLISRLKWFNVYWWIVLAYVTIIWGWGISTFLAPCPKLTTLESALSCITGPQADLAIRYSFAQVSLDVFGDLLILAIPIKLIWQVRVSWTQKIGLMTSLCLSIAMVGTSAARATGILRHGFLDSLWVIFWYFNSANIALTLSCAAAFRTLYLARRRSRSPHDGGSSGSSVASKVSSLKSRLLRLFRRGRFTPRNSENDEKDRWPKAAGGADGTTDSDSSLVQATPPRMRELPQPPRAMLTGLRTFISRNGRDSYFGRTSYMESDDDFEATRRFG